MAKSIDLDLSGLQTEGQNPKSINIDQVSTVELCQIINDEDATVSAAVEQCLPTIANAIDSLSTRVRQGGRVVYVGAGTSGRLGVLDASEIPPTYSASSEQFVALIAGGDKALRNAQEGAEDDVEAAVQDMKRLQLRGQLDSLIGIAASGRTPYVLSCLAYAKSLGCNTIAIACSFPSAMSRCTAVDHMISVVTGPEVVTGSTRMKAGTATKLVLNMLSTGTMIKTGKTYGNMMVDLKATNLKLQQRSRNILRGLGGTVCPFSDADIDELLRACDGSVKLAVAVLRLQSSVAEAKDRVEAADGVLSKALTPLNNFHSDQRTLNGINQHDFVLCIDGGGSKCAAAIQGKDGQIWSGEAGPCNVTDVGLTVALASISSAIQQAVDSCPRLKGTHFQSVEFSRIWVGLAGYDRETVSKPFDAALETMFQRRVGGTLKATNDIELVAAAAGVQHHLKSIIVLLAGTGSVAMSYLREGDSFARTGRCGGWGSLLGDDGSGYDIGRQGIRLALGSIDEHKLRKRLNPDVPPLDAFSRQILEHFAKDAHQALDNGLLDAVIAPDPGNAKSELEIKKKIAGVAKLVIDASATDSRAKAIAENAAQSLVRTTHPLLVDEAHEPSASILVLAGGLMQNPMFQVVLRDTVSSYGMKFGHVEVVNQPAIAGARYLAHLRWHGRR